MAIDFEVFEIVNLENLDECVDLIEGADYVIHSAGAVAHPSEVPTDFSKDFKIKSNKKKNGVPWQVTFRSSAWTRTRGRASKSMVSVPSSILKFSS